MKGDLPGTASRTTIEKWQRIYVNRSLNLANVQAVGFDMDHTLAVYNRERFEALAFRETLAKFIAAGYPEPLTNLQFKPDFVIRGLLVDMDRGNLLKVDCHKYVKKAYHGHQLLSKEERDDLYNRNSFRAFEFLSIDTHFALSEVQLYCEIVDFMRLNPKVIKKTFREVYRDLRHFIDLSHADGSIKTRVTAQPEEYVVRDKYLPQALVRLKEAGKRLFLLTNSDFAYTDIIMSHILSKRVPGYPSWRDYFDIVLVSARKPGFFAGKSLFERVDPTVNGPEAAPAREITKLSTDETYCFGNAAAFQDLTGFRGDQILFVGDHIYGDIMRSKGTVNWRTMLVVEELDNELACLERLRGSLQTIRRLQVKRELLDEQLQLLRTKITANERQAKTKTNGTSKRGAAGIIRQNEKYVEKALHLSAELQFLDAKIKQHIEDRASQVHKQWGELMKVSLERSRFADQVVEYACLYTSRVSNLRFYSPFKRFLSNHEHMPHDV